jgi:hypothetical protein
MDESALIRAKEELAERITHLRERERLTVVARVTDEGTTLHEVEVSGVPYVDGHINAQVDGIFELERPQRLYVYSLYQLPVRTNPLWISSVLRDLPGAFGVVTSFRGLNPFSIKRRLESSRRRNARSGSIVEIDSEVTFAETSQVLEGLSRGEETVVAASVVIFSDRELPLDPHHFILEKNSRLALASVFGFRRRFHRSHLLRAVNASDLVPNLVDPREYSTPLLRTPRGKPLYFNARDRRLEALHWLVSGGSGTGKSFFVGLMLRRMIRHGEPISVLFVDHNRSFRRLVRAEGGQYLEPQSVEELKRNAFGVLASLEAPRTIGGIELSDLDHASAKHAAEFLLRHVELFLRGRKTFHPVYVVLDECWNFLRDEPVLVQRAFREFRKLNGAAVAITQSLSDFLRTENGGSIFQNAPVRILLRQGEDMAPFRGALGINDVELGLLQGLRMKDGVYSECLIRTPFLSKLGRLYPTPEEFELLRTDNIREELVVAATAGRP